MISYEEVERIRNSGLPSTAKHILLELTIRKDADQKCWPSINTLSQNTGISSNHVRKRLNQLEKARWLRIHRRLRQSNVYEIRPIEEGPGDEFPTSPVGAPTSPGGISTSPVGASTSSGGISTSPAGAGSYMKDTKKRDHENHDPIYDAWKDSLTHVRLDPVDIQEFMELGSIEEIIDTIKGIPHAADVHPARVKIRLKIAREKERKKGQKRARK